MKPSPLLEYLDIDERKKASNLISSELDSIDFKDPAVKLFMTSWLMDRVHNLSELSHLITVLKHKNAPAKTVKTKEDVLAWLYVMGGKSFDESRGVVIKDDLSVEAGTNDLTLKRDLAHIPLKFDQLVHFTNEGKLNDLVGLPTSMGSLRIDPTLLKSVKGIPKELVVLTIGKYGHEDVALHWNFKDIAKAGVKIKLGGKLIVSNFRDAKDFIKLKPLYILSLFQGECELDFSHEQWTSKFEPILKRHMKQEQSLIDFQHELIEAGLEEFAEA